MTTDQYADSTSQGSANGTNDLYKKSNQEYIGTTEDLLNVVGSDFVSKAIEESQKLDILDTKDNVQGMVSPVKEETESIQTEEPYNINLDKFTCNVCGKRFKHTQNVYHHKKSQHEGVKYYCDQRDGSYKSKHLLASHTENVHEQKVQCELCAKYLSRPALHKYKLTEHEGLRFACDQCNLTFKHITN